MAFDGNAATKYGRKANRRPQAVKGVLGSVLRRYGLEQKLAQYQFVAQWPQIVGEEIARRSQPEYIANGQLIVRVCDSGWSQELSFQKHVIIKRLNRFFKMKQDGVLEIKDIIFYVSQQQGRQEQRR